MKYPKYGVWCKQNVIETVRGQKIKETKKCGGREQRKGGESMSLSERRQRLLEVLCLRRHDTYDNLAQEFNVSKMTIRREIGRASCRERV